ncbi:thioredoxin-dependent thiol peroxidase [Fimbriimonas ginsengisoli]|uniref:thioredoxin-dependent peroxiredoxin n=1 Tax=Fimbriimonas ginsengisoli Gsoil 348 TaxID=661478 RepID=A0A068NW91_FIMGI|nr:thioredoxin-dependent thiol peroxidase [Fimbriimonas ginsengisoli]AIE87716.1 peroxiredoxin [Fimbriimonas ginsengisoli Gsoil 348]
MIEEGAQFPDFSLSDQDGNTVSLADLKGRRAVIYFYPKDDTTGCTAEACEFRDVVPTVEGARIIGVSPDGVKSHRKFVDKYGLNFTLLADEGHELADQLGIWVEKSMYGKTYMGIERSTYVLDPNGKIEKIYRKVKPQGHAAEVLAALG